MSWRPHILWLGLAIVVTLIAWQLTRWITHVDHGPRAAITILFDEQPPFQFERLSVSLGALALETYRVPEAILTDQGNALLLFTAATRSITIQGVDPNDVSCSSLNELQIGSTVFLVEAGNAKELTPITIHKNTPDVFIPIPSQLHAALAHNQGYRGGINCTFLRPLASAPTFTERALTLHAQGGRGGAVLLNVSALEGIDDLRFSGGFQTPLGGERTRLLDSTNDVVSAEWTDVQAQEQRDIVLVTIGALSAIAAAMAIEAIRPFVERELEK
jgi:hypothetical protein